MMDQAHNREVILFVKADFLPEWILIGEILLG